MNVCSTYRHFSLPFTVCQDWQVIEDEGLAHQLQNHEINEHYDRNRQNSRLIRDDFHAARREQLSEQQLVEYARRQEELEAEELASQLTRLLDEEEHEEESQRRDEELARRIAQEEDELIAQEQQDRELARMLHARERLKAKKLREARKIAEAKRRQEEGSREQSNEIGEEYSDEALNEALYANLGPTQPRTHEVLGNSSIYLLQNSDIVNPPTGHQGSPTSTSRLSRDADGARIKSTVHRAPVARENNRKSQTRSFPEAKMESAIPPYMPMQGLPARLSPGATLQQAGANSLTRHPPQENHKKNSSCKTQ
ncbi:coiled-coil domain-containing protein 50 [Galendromus occidentalis]|uniref:Coiled-coil domain-containing protein 50 n=1 Tax=Galendromus occidentalis TaxID=34638 RepID=A0AAJ7SFD2_9ACAR|nr:coiled-coil domain-containing protein 50 [Galendromus occidentalis]